MFHRHARGLLLTEQGEFLYRTVHEVFHMLAMVESQLADGEIDPTMRETDVALRMGAPDQPDLTQRQLLQVGAHVYGSREYLR